MHKVVHVLAHSDVGVAGNLKFGEPSVISKASITDPVYEVVGAVFLWHDRYKDGRLGKTTTSASSTGRAGQEVIWTHIHAGAECWSCDFMEKDVLCDGNETIDVRGELRAGFVEVVIARN